MAAPRRAGRLAAARRTSRGRSRSWRSSSTCGRPTASAAPWPSSGPTSEDAPSPSRGRATPPTPSSTARPGRYDLTQTIHGFVAVINDLHKGRDTGRAWSVLIDVSAVVLIVISLTGLVLLFYLKRRRIPGLVVAVGTVAVVAVVLLLVP